MIQRISKAATIVEAACNHRVRGHYLRGRDVIVDTGKVPPKPCGLAWCGGIYRLGVLQRNVAIIETYAENSVCAEFANMAGNVDDPVQAERLHMSALVRQGLIPDHVAPETEVVVHIFGIHAEHAGKFHADSELRLSRIADKACDISAADARSTADAIGKVTKIYLCRSRCDESAKGQ